MKVAKEWKISIHEKEHKTVKNNRTVTDSGEGVCVDPGEKGAILEAGGPARQEGEKAGSRL
jgi:ribosomal protein S5